MKRYQFRTNWRGQLILQRRYSQPSGYFGDREYVWYDADTSDLKDYYEQLHNLQTSCACQEQRRQFDAECG